MLFYFLTKLRLLVFHRVNYVCDLMGEVVAQVEDCSSETVFTKLVKQYLFKKYVMADL